MRGLKSKWHWLLAGVVLFFAVILITRTLSRGDDFLVFYRVTQGFWSGISPYDVSLYGNMVFKYPPWILPFFLPLGLFSVWPAKLMWGLVQAFSLIFIVQAMDQKARVTPWIQIIFLGLFFGVIGIHGMVGQISLPLLALAIALDPRLAMSRRMVFLAWAFSSKIVTLFPLMDPVMKRSDRFRLVSASIVLCIFLTLPILTVSYKGEIWTMAHDWLHAMFSGTETLQSVRIGFTSREAQGLPGFLIRVFHLDETERLHVMGSVLLSVLVTFGFWKYFSRTLNSRDRWWGWLALTPVVQPLAWFHFFIFAYPVLVVGSYRAWMKKDYLRFSLTIFAGVLVGAITQKTLGELGLALEMLSVKSWGVILGCILFSQVREPLSAQVDIAK
jgi:hypothetical protein